MSAPAATNTSQGNIILTINLKPPKTARTALAIPLVYGEDAAASAAATGLARVIHRQLDVRAEADRDSNVVRDLVQSARDGKYVSLSRTDVLHVYLLGWAWVAGGLKELHPDSLEREPLQERLRELLTSGEADDESFIDELCADEGSVAWMRRILNAAATAL